MKPGHYISNKDDSEFYWENLGSGYALCCDGHVAVLYPEDVDIAFKTLKDLVEEEESWIYVREYCAQDASGVLRSGTRIKKDGSKPQYSVYSDTWVTEKEDATWVIAFRKALEL